MSKVETTYIIPARNERFMPHTVRDILKNSGGDIEIVVILEGYRPPQEDITKDERVRYIYNGTPKGLRGAINQGAAIANGKFLIKIDAHCSISKNFDRVLAESSKPDVVQVARRGRLDALNWCEQFPDPIRKPFIDLEYLSYPDDPKDFGGTNMTGKIWTSKILENLHIPIEPTIGFQGSMWHMEKSFFEKAGLMNEKLYLDFWQECQEIVFNTYLVQNSICQVNKNAKYLHLHKGKNNIAAADGRAGRGFRLNESSLRHGRNTVMRFWEGEKVYGEKQVHPLSYLIEKFPDMPGWTPERISELKERERKHGWRV